MKKLHSFLFVVWLCHQVFAQEGSFKPIKNKEAFIQLFSQKSEAMQSNEADFVQENFISILTEKTISKGKFYYQRENKMRWETTSPSNQIIVLNNGKVTLKKDGKIKSYDANAHKQLKSLYDVMLNTASGNFFKSKDYSFTIAENNKFYLVEITPIQQSLKKQFKQINLLIEKVDWSVSQLKLIENSDDYIKINFSNKKINERMDALLFILN